MYKRTINQTEANQLGQEVGTNHTGGADTTGYKDTVKVLNCKSDLEFHPFW